MSTKIIFSDIPCHNIAFEIWKFRMISWESKIWGDDVTMPHLVNLYKIFGIWGKRTRSYVRVPNFNPYLLKRLSLACVFIQTNPYAIGVNTRFNLNRFSFSPG